MRPTYALREIKSSFNHCADAQPFLYRYVIRPVSFFVTYGVLKVRMTANQATLIGLLFGMAGVFLFFKGVQPYVAWGVVWYALARVFDFVDGNIARVTNSASYWGKFVDGIVDASVETFLPLSLVIGFFGITGSVVFLYFGIATSILYLLSYFIFTRLSFFNRWMDAELRDSSPLYHSRRDLNPLKTSRFPLIFVTNVTVDLKMAGVFLVAFIGVTPELLALILIAINAQTIPSIVVPLLDARSNLNVHRVSKWDSHARK